MKKLSSSPEKFYSMIAIERVKETIYVIYLSDKQFESSCDFLTAAEIDFVTEDLASVLLFFLIV